MGKSTGWQARRRRRTLGGSDHIQFRVNGQKKGEKLYLKDQKGRTLMTMIKVTVVGDQKTIRREKDDKLKQLLPSISKLSLPAMTTGVKESWKQAISQVDALGEHELGQLTEASSSVVSTATTASELLV